MSLSSSSSSSSSASSSSLELYDWKPPKLILHFLLSDGTLACDLVVSCDETDTAALIKAKAVQQLLVLEPEGVVPHGWTRRYLLLTGSPLAEDTLSIPDSATINSFLETDELYFVMTNDLGAAGPTVAERVWLTSCLCMTITCFAPCHLMLTALMTTPMLPSENLLTFSMRIVRERGVMYFWHGMLMVWAGCFVEDFAAVPLGEKLGATLFAEGTSAKAEEDYLTSIAPRIVVELLYSIVPFTTHSVLCPSPFALPSFALIKQTGIRIAYLFTLMLTVRHPLYWPYLAGITVIRGLPTGDEPFAAIASFWLLFVAARFSPMVMPHASSMQEAVAETFNPSVFNPHTWLNFLGLLSITVLIQDRLRKRFSNWGHNRLNFWNAKYGRKKLQRVLWATAAGVLSSLSAGLLGAELAIGLFSSRRK